MCGGGGTRLDRGEKPLFEVAGAPMIARVLGALASSDIEGIIAATSPRTPETTRWLERRGGVRVLETAGDGYVADLTSALERVGRPVLTVAADLPLLAGENLNQTLGAYGSGGMTVCVPAALKRRLGVSVDTTRTRGGRELAPTGLNVVGADGGPETVRVSHDARLAVNVNRPGDAAVAESLAPPTGGDR
ncbi:NTP transferase domain-containing protein [Natronomonas sp.]|uniref:NTP transferase domain-containing protein n=1 Tax=Natronomonas sp. TaxID=2184060 RepID=UPI0026175C13|nr:NTP transferase domain-containing protein [Natronomonas sp.]